MPVESPTPVVRATNLSYARNGEEIIHRFSFEILAGDYVAVIGPNGGGKSTLLRLMLGLLPPTGGSVEVLGGPATDACVRRQIGYVAQRGGNLDPLFPATVEEVVRSGRMPHVGLFGRFKEHDEEAITRAAREMGLEDLWKRPLSKLSGGERQKVLLARAMAGEPKILCLDEPTDGLDPLSRDGFYDMLRRINASGVTIVFVSHDIHAVAREARSAICLKHQLVCHGDSACHIGREELRDLFHPDREDMLSHHKHHDHA
mgnify:CR=1 FL=1